MSATYEELCQLHDIGPRVTKAISEWTSSSKNKSLVDRLLQLGFTIDSVATQNTQTSEARKGNPSHERQPKLLSKKWRPNSIDC